MKSLLAIALLVSSTTFANQTEINTIEQASMKLNNTVLINVASNNQGYIKALAYYRLSVNQNINTNPKVAVKSLNIAISELESVVKINPNDDESWALLSQCYGFKTLFDPMNIATLGAKAEKALNTALTLDPSNPRVMLFKGIMSFNTPAMYGGSKKLAIKSLSMAIDLFADDQNSDNYWGEAEAHVWRGLSYQAINDNVQAIADFEKALDISPEFSWAKMLLNNNK